MAHYYRVKKKENFYADIHTALIKRCGATSVNTLGSNCDGPDIRPVGVLDEQKNDDLRAVESSVFRVSSRVLGVESGNLGSIIDEYR